MKLKTTHEKNVRPEYDAAASKLAKATDALAEARAELATAEANVKAHEALADTEDEKPAGWAHDGAEKAATVQWFARIVQSKASAVAEAQAEYDSASRKLALARMSDRAATIAAFDRDEFMSKYAAKLAPLVEAAYAEIHALTDLEAEVASIAREAGIDSTDPRYTHDGSRQVHVFDGVDLHPAGLTSSTVETAFELPEDPRLVQRRDALAAEDRERRQADRQREAEAEAEWERNAPMRAQHALFQQAHDNWEAERLRRSRAFESTADMGPEPVQSDPRTW